MMRGVLSVLLVLLSGVPLAAQFARKPPADRPHLQVDLTARGRFDRALALFEAGKPSPDLETAAIEFLKSTSIPYRARALHALSKLQPRSPQVVQAYLYALQDGSPDLRSTAVQLIGEMGEDAIPLMPQLHDCFEAERQRKRMFELDGFFDSLLKIDPSMQHWKLIVAEAVRPDERQWISPIAGLIENRLFETPELTDHIAKLLEDQSPEVRAAGITLAAHVGPEANYLQPNVAKLLDDESLYVRRLAAETAGQIGLPSDETSEKLRSLMNDEDIYLRMMAARGYWRATKRFEEVDQVLSETIPLATSPSLGSGSFQYDHDKGVYLKAAFVTLGEIGTNVQASWPILKRLYPGPAGDAVAESLATAVREIDPRSQR